MADTTPVDVGHLRGETNRKADADLAVLAAIRVGGLHESSSSGSLHAAVAAAHGPRSPGGAVRTVARLSYDAGGSPAMTAPLTTLHMPSFFSLMGSEEAGGGAAAGAAAGAGCGGGGGARAAGASGEGAVGGSGGGAGGGGAGAASGGGGVGDTAVSPPAKVEVRFVTDEGAFNRVHLGTPSLSKEEVGTTALLREALRLRVRNRVCRVPVYTFGAFSPADFPGFAAPEAPAENEFGIREGVLSDDAPRPVEEGGAACDGAVGLAAPPSPSFTPCLPFPADTAGQRSWGAGSCVGFEQGEEEASSGGGFAGGRSVFVSAAGKRVLAPERPWAPPRPPVLPREARLQVHWHQGVVTLRVVPSCGGGSSGGAGGGAAMPPPSAALTPLSGDTSPAAELGLSLEALAIEPSTGATWASPADGVSWRSFSEAYTRLLQIVHEPKVRSFAYHRLKLLETRFGVHKQLNADIESFEQRMAVHRDFYNVRKVDTHVHHSACMNQKLLLNFMKHKLREEGDTVCIKGGGGTPDKTLKEVFKELGLNERNLSLDTLSMHANTDTFHRFDRFNLKYDPAGHALLRTIFLKTKNDMEGRFLAEITRAVMKDLVEEKYQYSEYRLSIYGTSLGEWDLLGKWMTKQVGLANSSHVRWMIQVPRLYDKHVASKAVVNFGQLLRNFFEPLFRVTLDPASSPDLHAFLTLVSGIDLVDDESLMAPPPETGLADMPPPDEWAHPYNPPFMYWCWYFSTNLAVLNKLRGERGLTQLSFRPHCGEAGDPNHLAAAFLTAESINHGINLKAVPALQYLYYLAQIGLAMSPVSNGRLFLEIQKNPFPRFFECGMNVSLSTDDPLMLHYTRNPLLEEYAVASQVYRLDPVDMAELARNSVLQSGFEYPFKARWVGEGFAWPGPSGSKIEQNNVPYTRLQYRLEVLRGELHFLGVKEDQQPRVKENLAKKNVRISSG